MKPIVVAIGLLAGAVAAVPFVVGMYVKEDAVARIEFANKELQAQWGTQSSVRVVNYRLGWLRSVADVETKLVMELPDEPPRTAVHVEPITIEHGPLPGILGGDTRPGWAVAHSSIKVADLITAFAGMVDDASVVDPIRKALADYPPVRSEMRVEFDGSGEWSLHGEPFQILDAECCSRLSWSALSGQGRVAPNLADTKGAVAMERMEFTERENGGRVVMEGLGLSFDLKRDPSGLDLGKMEWTMKGLSGSGQGQQFKMAGLTFGGESAANGPALRTRFTSRLESADGAGPDGVQHKIGWDMGFELNGLDLAATNVLIKGVQEMGGKMDDPENQAKLQGLMMDLADKSLKHQPGLRLVPMNISMDGQQITGNVELGLVGANMASLMANPAGAVHYLKGMARLSVPDALLAIAQIDEQQVAMLVEQGLIRREGANLIAEAKLEPGGKLSVNGKPMDLPPM